jgi:hydroxymethylbilane synthase
MRIGTRKSTMALAQTEEIARRLHAAWSDLTVEVVKFDTRGDDDQVSKLLRHGGKGGAFVSEIRAAVLKGELHAAMHSLKDMPGNEEAPGLVIGATLEREPPGDALVVRDGISTDDIKRSKGKGFKIGTNSIRRASYLRHLFPEVEVIHFRGAADTRIKKLDAHQLQLMPDGSEGGPVDALVMARSGLERIGFSARIVYDFPLTEMLPSVGQGIVAVECAEADWSTRGYLSRIDDTASRMCTCAEREVLWILNGHCNSPIAGHATIAGSEMTLRAAVIEEDGSRFIEVERTGNAARPRELGRMVGLELLGRGACEVIERTRPES